MIHDLSTYRCDSLPDWLSCFPEKLKCYATDDDFFHGWATLEELHSRGVFCFEQLWNLGSVLFKADTVLRRNGLCGIRFLEASGFQVRAVRQVTFSNERVEKFWRYSLGRLSVERVDLLKRLQTISPSLYLVVESAGSGSRLPCSLRVTELKGQAVVAQRHAGNLRYAMGDPQSAFFNFVHTADEPSDFVRELGLLFNEGDRENLIFEALCGARPDAEGAYKALVRKRERSDLDFSCAVGRLRQGVISANVLERQERAECLGALERLQDTGYGSWLELRGRLRMQGVRIGEIDDIVISGGLVALKQAKPTQPFPSCEARHWEHHKPLHRFCSADVVGLQPQP